MAMPIILQMPVTDMASAIQLSLAPVFLLNGIGVLLAMLTSRLARIVDRARTLEHRLREASAHEAAELVGILAIIRTRARLMNQSITLGTVSALLVAMVVALLFTSAMISFSLSTLVGLFFIVSMLALVAALISFLVEVRVATASLRIGPNKSTQSQGD